MHLRSSSASVTQTSRVYGDVRNISCCRQITRIEALIEFCRVQVNYPLHFEGKKSKSTQYMKGKCLFQVAKIYTHLNEGYHSKTPINTGTLIYLFEALKIHVLVYCATTSKSLI